MKTSIYTGLMFLCLTLTLCASGQDRIRFREASVRLGGLEARPDALFREAAAEIERGQLEVSAQPLLRATTSFTQEIFRVPGLQFEKAVTLRRTGDIWSEGDVLLARWRVDEPYGRGTLIVEDTPAVWRYYLRMTDCSLRSREALGEFWSQFVLFDAAPLNARSVTIETQAIPNETGDFQAEFGTFPSAVGVIRSVYVSGLTRGSECFVRIQAGKKFRSSSYPYAPFVPERFPPLDELMKSWSTTKIRSEVGTRFSLISEDRDEVLITEFARRGMSAEEFVDLLRNVPPGFVQTRMQVVLRALGKVGVSPLPLSYLDSALAFFEGAYPRREDSVESLFRYASTTCTPHFEQRALRLLKSGLFHQGPLRYLGECGVSEDVLAVVETSPLPEQYVEWRRYTAREIRKRMDAARQVR
ncbi:MAG: hypothetical protein JNL98_34365 [Bryobacterales bacterium]|nr:hypothetical protein [Bryobacterales bacterium]